MLIPRRSGTQQCHSPFESSGPASLESCQCNLLSCIEKIGHKGVRGSPLSHVWIERGAVMRNVCPGTKRLGRWLTGHEMSLFTHPKHSQRDELITISMFSSCGAVLTSGAQLLHTRSSGALQWDMPYITLKIVKITKGNGLYLKLPLGNYSVEVDVSC